MPQPQEVEFKFRVADAGALERLLGVLGAGAAVAPVRQVNHFFDTSDLALRGMRVALRVREEAGRFLLTLKGPKASGSEGALAVRGEEEAELGAEEARAVLGGERPVLASLAAHLGDPESALQRLMHGALDGRAPRHVGSFENERTRVGPVSVAGAGGPFELLFELDRSTFPGPRIDHEIEVEVPDGLDAGAVRSALEVLLHEAGITWSETSSKAHRFFAALGH